MAVISLYSPLTLLGQLSGSDWTLDTVAPILDLMSYIRTDRLIMPKLTQSVHFLVCLWEISVFAIYNVLKYPVNCVQTSQWAVDPVWLHWGSAGHQETLLQHRTCTLWIYQVKLFPWGVCNANDNNGACDAEGRIVILSFDSKSPFNSFKTTFKIIKLSVYRHIGSCFFPSCFLSVLLLLVANYTNALKMKLMCVSSQSVVEAEGGECSSQDWAAVRRTGRLEGEHANHHQVSWTCSMKLVKKHNTKTFVKFRGMRGKGQI